MSRPGVTRIASTNLGSGNGYRVLDGKVAIVTGASRGKHKPTMEIQVERLLKSTQVSVLRHARTSLPRAAL